MKKTLSLLVGLGLIVACLAGCSDKKPVTSTPTNSELSENSDLVSIPTSGSQGENGESGETVKTFNTTVTEEFTGVRAKYTVKLPAHKDAQKVEITEQDREADCYFFESATDPDVFYCVAEYYGKNEFPLSGRVEKGAGKAGEVDDYVISVGTRFFTDKKIYSTTECRNTKVELPGSSVEAYRYVGEMMGPAPDYKKFAFAKGVLFYAADNNMPITVFVVEASQTHMKEADTLVDNIIASIRS